MKREKITHGISLTLLALAAVGCKTEVARAQEKSPARDIELTIYSQDFALIRDKRSIDLGKGVTRIGFPNVSKELDQQSVLFTWADKTEPAKVLSSTFDLGIGNSERLLERFVGQTVELVRYGSDGDEAERIKGVLQVADPGNVVLLSEGKYLINPPGTIVAPGNVGIASMPQLSAEFDSAAQQKTDLVMTYVTGGLSWNADYVATLDPASDELKLECWASVTNRTGSDYPEAKINFAVGAPNTYRNKRDSFDADYKVSEESARSTRPQSQSLNAVYAPITVGESYIYPRKTTATIKQDQMNRVRMINADTVPVERDYALHLPVLDYGGYYNYAWTTEANRINATLSISFKNTEKSGLGYPLPGGGLRVYERDSANMPQFSGSATLRTSPKDSKVMATLSSVMDVYAEPKLTKKIKVDKRTSRKTVEVKLSNAKSKDVELRIVQDFYGSWKIVSETEKSRKLNPNTNEWKVKVPANGSKTLTYTVQLK